MSGKNARFTLRHTAQRHSNQKTESCEYIYLRALTMFKVTNFPFCRASDVSPSYVDTFIIKASIHA